MTPEELATRQDRAQTVPMIISPNEGGFRVYSPADRKQPYVIGGTPSLPSCTCPDFLQHRDDPQWRCTHLLAVMNQRAGPGSGANGNQVSGHPEPLEQPHKERNGGSMNGNADPITMLLKRSVSPDGRINSLSIELSCLVPADSPGAVDTRATAMLRLHDGITQRFLSKREEQPEREAPPVTVNIEPVPATILNIGALDGQYGRRLFLRFQVNGKTLRHFGNQTQLGEYLTSAGFPELASEVEENLELNLPCQVTTKRAKNPKYVDIDQVLPAATAQVSSQDAW